MPPKTIKDHAVEIGDEPHFHEADRSKNAPLDRFHREHPRRPSPLSASTTSEELGGPPKEDTLGDGTPSRPPSPALQRPRLTINTAVATASTPSRGPVSPDTPVVSPVSPLSPVSPINLLSSSPAPRYPVNLGIRPTGLRNPVLRIDTSSSQSSQTTKWIAHVPPATFAPSDVAASLTDQRTLLNQRELIRRRIAPVLEPALHPETRVSSVNVAGMYRAIRTVRAEITDVKDWQLAEAVKDYVGQFGDWELFKGRYFRANRDRIRLRDQNRFLEGEVRRLEMAQRAQRDILQYKTTQRQARGMDQDPALSADSELQALRDELASRDAAVAEWSETEDGYIKEVSNIEKWINDLQHEKETWKRDEAKLRLKVKELKKRDTQQQTELASSTQGQGTSSNVSSSLPSSETTQDSTSVASQLRADNTTLQRHLQDAQAISASMTTRLTALTTETSSSGPAKDNDEALIAEVERLSEENERLMTAMDQMSRQISATRRQQEQAQSQPDSSSASTQTEVLGNSDAETQSQGPAHSDASSQTTSEDEDGFSDTPGNPPTTAACQRRCAELLALLAAERNAHAHTQALFRDFRIRVGEAQLSQQQGQSSQSSTPEEEEEEEEEDPLEETSDTPDHQPCRRLLQDARTAHADTKEKLRVVWSEFKNLNRAHSELLDEFDAVEVRREREEERRDEEIRGWQGRLRGMREMIEEFDAGRGR